VITKLNAAVTAALGDPEVSRKLLQAGAIPAPGSPQQLTDHLKSELARWGKVIREKNIKPES
jgi:tripartite-type tricarboxylate transporter receptor subunit TctC